MQMPRNTVTRRTPRTPRAGDPTVGARFGRRAAQRAIPFATERGRRATRRGRFGGVALGRFSGAPATTMRRKRSSRRSSNPLARGLLGALGSSTRKRSKGSRKGPALLAVLAGLGAAGAGVLKRRRSGDDQPPAYVPPTKE